MDIPHAATHSSLDIFQKPSVLINFDSGNCQQYFPTTAADGPSLEFTITTDRNVFLDMDKINLKLTAKILKADGNDIE